MYFAGFYPSTNHFRKSTIPFFQFISPKRTITASCHLYLPDRLGYMWFGTRNGLNKFNGNNFETFWNHADDECSISNNTIACITEDAEGNLWFGTENGLNKLDKRRNGFKRYYFDPEANAANNKIISSSPIRKARCGWEPSPAYMFLMQRRTS